MEIVDGDLSGFVDEWMLADQAEVTVRGYLACLNKHRSWCETEGVGRLTMQGARRHLVEVAGASKWQGYMLSRSLKAFGRFIAAEYKIDDPFKDPVGPSGLRPSIKTVGEPANPSAVGSSGLTS